jgi:putative hemolysin
MTGETVETFSYAEPGDPRLKRFIIRMIERMTGQPYLKSLYDDRFTRRLPGESFWDLAIRLLDLKIVTNEDALARIPKTGPLVVVANHPFGVLDGVIICHLVARVRSDFRILTNAVLNRADEVKEFLLPVDFTETEEALQTNLKSRAAAKHLLLSGGCLIVFPAGAVATTPKLWDRTAVDAEWKNLTARLIAQGRAPVVPVFFAGQNSRLFQFASHLSMTLRLSLLFKEVRDSVGSDIVVRIGDVIPFETLTKIEDRQQLMNVLREATYALGKDLPPRRKRAKSRA